MSTSRSIALAAKLGLDTTEFDEKFAAIARKFADRPEPDSFSMPALPDIPADPFANWTPPADLLPAIEPYAAQEKAVARLAADQAENLKDVASLYDTNSALARTASQALGSTFANALSEGKKFDALLESVAANLAKLALNSALREFLGPLAGLGSTAGISGFFADGGRPPVGQVSLVGERGPELFVPDVAGTIVPNHRLADGGGGNVYQIDARGADEGAVARIEAVVLALAGPGVVERRALAAQVGALRRGGGLARAMS